MGYEMQAVRIERPLQKPPKGYRDPSEFKDAEQRASLESISEKAAVQKAVEIANMWNRKELEQRKKQTERLADSCWGLSPQAVADKLEQQLEGVENDATRKKELLSDVSEALHHLRQKETHDPLVKDTITGMEQFLADQTIMVSPEAKATWKKLKAEQLARNEAQLRENHAREMPVFVNPNTKSRH